MSGNALGVVTPGAGSIDYHANGLVSSVGMNNNVTWQQAITSHWMARPTSITTSGATNNLALSNYAYDGAGNITSDGVDAFRYDKVSRLVSGTANGATQAATYDSFGNIKTLGAATLSPTATTNRLPATLASYAANGAVTAHGGDLFDLDPFGMIQAAHDPTYGVKYWAFVYTADDERIWKYDMGPANTSWWKIRDLGGKVLSEYVNVGASWTAVSSYIYRDGTLLGRYAPGTSYPRRWFAVDHLGTPRRTFGENGSLIEAASYFPFGGHATTPGPAEESLRFTSHERDAAIAGGIDYMHARFYAPGVGRFLSVDPATENATAAKPQSWNRYSYSLNGPLTYVDPTGETALLIVGQPTTSRRFPYVNPFGHVAASAIDTAFSYGTQWARRSGQRDWGVPLGSYIDGAYPNREMKFYAFSFDANMEAAFFEALRAQRPNPGSYNLWRPWLPDMTCVSVIRNALVAIGVLPAGGRFETPIELVMELYERGYISHIYNVDVAIDQQPLSNFWSRSPLSNMINDRAYGGEWTVYYNGGAM